MSTTSGVSSRACTSASRPSLASPDHLDVLLRVEDQAKSPAHERLVVGDQDADHDRPATTGSATRTDVVAARLPPRLDLAAVDGDALAQADEPAAPVAAVVGDLERRSRRAP